MVELRIGDGVVEFLAYEEFEERVLAGRIPDNAEVRFAPVTGEAFVRAHELDLVESLRNAERVAWRDRFMRSGPPLLTVFLVGIQIRIWCAAQVPGLGDWLAGSGMNWLPPALEDGETYRILTSGLLHTDFLHVLLNMVWMAYTGWNLERALGRANVAAIFFFSVFLGGILSMFLTPTNPSLGASGGVYGLVAASVVFGFIRQDILPEKGRNLFGAALAPYLILMFFSGLSDARTDNWAHFGGIVAGSILAFVLDPPGYERGSRNRIVQLGGTAVILAMLLFMSLFGPSIHPLIDQEQARLDAMPRQARSKQVATADLLSDLSYRVPAGWKPGIDVAGQTAFLSPAGIDERSWSVQLTTGEEPLDLDVLVDRWTDRFAVTEPDLVFTTEDTVWFGLPAREVRATLHDGTLVEFRGAVRGMYGLQRVKAGSPKTLARLAPLFARADASIVWPEPIRLRKVRANAMATPNGVKANADLALELARWGDADDAIRIQRKLVDDLPSDPERWRDLLRIVGWYGADRDFEAVAEEALALPQVLPSLVVSIADALRDDGEESVADGLLQIEWFRVPADRDVKRALRKADLPFVLTEDGRPSQLVRAGLEDRDPAEIERISALPLTLDAARSVSAMLARERAALAATFDPQGPEPHAALLTIRDGGIGEGAVAEAAFKSLRRDLSAVEGDRAPRWMSPALVEILERDGVIEALRATDPSRRQDDALPTPPSEPIVPAEAVDQRPD